MHVPLGHLPLHDSHYLLADRMPRPPLTQFAAPDSSQKYKEGKYILEKVRISRRGGNLPRGDFKTPVTEETREGMS